MLFCALLWRNLNCTLPNKSCELFFRHNEKICASYMLLKILTAFYLAVFGQNFCFTPDLHGGGVFGKLKDHYLAPVQLFGVVKPGVLAPGQSNDGYTILQGLDYHIFPTNVFNVSLELIHDWFPFFSF